MSGAQKGGGVMFDEELYEHGTWGPEAEPPEEREALMVFGPRLPDSMVDNPPILNDDDIPF